VDPTPIGVIEGITAMAFVPNKTIPGLFAALPTCGNGQRAALQLLAGRSFDVCRHVDTERVTAAVICCLMRTFIYVCAAHAVANVSRVAVATVSADRVVTPRVRVWAGSSI
jgi:hypothetical protein